MCYNCNYNDYIILVEADRYKYPLRSLIDNIGHRRTKKSISDKLKSFISKMTLQDIYMIDKFKKAKVELNNAWPNKETIPKYYNRMLENFSCKPKYKQGDVLPLIYISGGDLKEYVQKGITLRATDDVVCGEPYHFMIPLYKERNNLVGFNCLHKHTNYDKQKTRVTWRSFVDQHRIEFGFPYLSYKEQDKKHFRDIILTNDACGYIKLMNWFYTDWYDSINNPFSKDIQIIYLIGDFSKCLDTLMDYDWTAEIVTNLCQVPKGNEILFNKMNTGIFYTEKVRSLDYWESTKSPLSLSEDCKTLCHYINKYFKLRTYHPNMSHTGLPEECHVHEQSQEETA